VLAEPVPIRSADGCRTVTLGPELGSRLLRATVLELDPGETSESYHYVYGRERWLLVLVGGPTLRHRDGESPRRPADIVCLPDGPAGAHQLLNRSRHIVRALLLATTGLPANAYYPKPTPGSSTTRPAPIRNSE
jgi:uncharacterized cupin superfamily protein